MKKKQKILLIRIITAILGLIALYFVPSRGYYRLIGYIAIYLVVGFDTLKKAIRGIINFRPLDENFLMTVATIGAFVLAVLTKSGDFTEGVAVMLFYRIGEFFESVAVGKSRRNISALMDIRPDFANLVCENGDIVETSPETVSVGSEIIVNPGEKIPMDGIVVEGYGDLDTIAITGESMPKSVAPGDSVTSGCIAINSVLKIKTTKAFGESTVSRILELVENASSRKSKSESFISRFAKIYTPVVCGLALLLATIVPLVRILINKNPLWTDWIYRALSFLVVSCPCALVISVPLCFFAGLGGAGKAGILIKGSNYLEMLSKVKTVVFDKTGTLTYGKFDVTEIISVGMTEEKLIEYAAYAESASSHPIARSILNYYNGQINRNRVTEIKEIAGKGVSARVDNCLVLVGNLDLTKDSEGFTECKKPGTVVYVVVDGKYSGAIIISDAVKDTSRDAIRELRKNGVARIVMLTGDNEEIAGNVAKTVGTDEYYASLLPDEKVSALEKILNANAKVAFVGDGINDAPVLARADVGIAMGAMGSDAAIEAADVVLMDDNPLKIAKAVKISKKCLMIVRENITMAIFVKVVCLLLTAFGISNMWLAIFADVGVMIIAVLNSIRAINVHKI